MRLSCCINDRRCLHQRSALRTALLPAIDSTKVVGLISLPGAMTGLILAGVDLLSAIRYQIVVVDMLLAPQPPSPSWRPHGWPNTPYSTMRTASPPTRNASRVKRRKAKDSQDLRPLRLHVKTGSS
jgi:hypothetical protein